MGIGDKQRIERERREKYIATMHEHFRVHGGLKFDALVDAVLALVDAEIEPLQEQIERDGERIATMIGRPGEIDLLAAEAERDHAEAERSTQRVQIEALEATIQNAIETMVWLEAEGAEPYERLREILEGTVPEPVYEYAHRHRDTGQIMTKRWDSAETAKKMLEVWTFPDRYEVIRRPKPQDWEDVQ